MQLLHQKAVAAERAVPKLPQQTLGTAAPDFPKLLQLSEELNWTLKLPPGVKIDSKARKQHPLRYFDQAAYTEALKQYPVNQSLCIMVKDLTVSYDG